MDACAVWIGLALLLWFVVDMLEFQRQRHRSPKQNGTPIGGDSPEPQWNGRHYLDDSDKNMGVDRK